MTLPNPTEEMETIGLLILVFVGFVFVFGIIPMLWKMTLAKYRPEARLKNALLKEDEADE